MQRREEDGLAESVCFSSHSYAFVTPVIMIEVQRGPNRNILTLVCMLSHRFLFQRAR